MYARSFSATAAAADDEEDNSRHACKYIYIVKNIKKVVQKRGEGIKRKPDETAAKTMPTFNENPSRAKASFSYFYNRQKVKNK